MAGIDEKGEKGEQENREERVKGWKEGRDAKNI
jgi:hypothetical protein